ncbi:MAG: hypothetical protein RM368_05255 [Nostoc sp. DedSLP03]|nr:hypothetical protein [Nostoc sp. DedSLP03]
MLQSRICLLGLESVLVLFVADLFHPVHELAVEYLLSGDISHRRWR